MLDGERWEHPVKNAPPFLEVGQAGDGFWVPELRGDGNSTPVVTALVRTRLTGFAANRVKETQTTDELGNTTVQTVDVDRTAATATLTTSRVGHSGAQIETQLAGLAISVTGYDGLTTRAAYDSLLRKWQDTDSRGNTTTTAYASGSTLVSSITDATSTIIALKTYDTLGRVVSQAGAPDTALAGSPRHYVYSAYNARGNLWRQWGDATYPVEYGDNAFGERASMSTFRGGTGWDQASWPGTGTNTAHSPDPADTTTWAYDAATGQLASKTDAAGAAAAYTYTAGGQLATRQWARRVNPSDSGSAHVTDDLQLRSGHG